MKVTFRDGSTELYEDTPLTTGATGAIFLSHDKQSVVKLYHPDPKTDAEHIRRLDIIVNELNPSKDDGYWAQFFLWPERIVIRPRVGYRMPFVSGLKTLNHYIFPKSYYNLRPQEKGWFIGIVAAAIKLFTAANRLEELGICYADYSDRGLMVDPFDGRMILVNCDEITVQGRLAPTVEGTSWYRAPEIVSRKVTIPSIKSDRHALAVLLYNWLVGYHPLLGDRPQLDPDPERDDLLRFGEEALYIEHPTDNANHNKNQRITAAALGPELQKLFQTAFVDGLHHPDKRPSPYEWQRALFHTYDQIIPCASKQCRWHFFVATPKQRLACPMCSQPLSAPQTLPFVYLIRDRGVENLDQYVTKTNAHYIVGWPGRLLYQWHIGFGDPLKPSDTRACAVFEYDQYRKQWYLKNLTLYDMLYTLSNEANEVGRPLPIDSSLPLDVGIVVHFGRSPMYFSAYIKIVKTI